MFSEAYRDVPAQASSGGSSPTIETLRLNLRVPREADFDTWAAIMADVESSRYFGGPTPRLRSWLGLAEAVGHWQLRGYGFFSAALKSTGQCVGFAGPFFPEGWVGREVGWQLQREYWGQGFAYEATVAILHWVSRELRWTDVIHCIHPDNKSSIALALRIGSRFLRTARPLVGPPGNDVDYHIYGQNLPPESG